MKNKKLETKILKFHIKKNNTKKFLMNHKKQIKKTKKLISHNRKIDR